MTQQTDNDSETVRVASNLIAHFEQYLSTARWDVNAYRNGFGSDTDGAEQTKVYKGEFESKAAALANLAARIPKFILVCKAQVGEALWYRLGVSTQAALTSMAYNYGRIPAAVVAAIQNHPSTVSDVIRSCGRDNHGINQWRRDGESAVVALDGGQY